MGVLACMQVMFFCFGAGVGGVFVLMRCYSQQIYFFLKISKNSLIFIKKNPKRIENATNNV